MLAPNTFRMPISLVRCSAVNIARPNKPREEIKMARKNLEPKWKRNLGASPDPEHGLVFFEDDRERIAKFVDQLPLR